ncbi:MAG: hypothetical protein LBQ09_01220 [Acidobacteriaceae bacterium]|jgi:hypothetical protein|nr:hypothetical protein [Acidobacteriaceae bacterium]
MRSPLRIIFATAASAVVMFSLAGLYTGVLARDFIASHVDSSMLRTPPNLMLVFAGYVVLAALMSVLYSTFGPFASSNVWSGVRFGWLMAVLWLMPTSLVLFGVYRFPYVALPLDFAWALVEQGIGGVIVALVVRPSGRMA